MVRPFCYRRGCLSFEFEAGVETVVAREEGGEGREALDVGD